MFDRSRCLLFLVSFMIILTHVSADTYIVKIATEQYINLVDSRFLSFTVDPKYLFSSRDKYSSKESICMASALTPAYIRIAGPSTSHMTFHNSTITFTDLNLEKISGDNERSQETLAVTHGQWRKFVKWAKSTGFDLVFALNNEEKTESGLWDPNTALNILTVADKARIGEMFWQLGYECRNQSIEDYLNDLETLRVITETFPAGAAGSAAREWRVVGADVTQCLHTHSKSDFKDFVTLSDDMLDAVLLNGNSSAQELDRMSESDRFNLLKRLSKSFTPLWITETPHSYPEDPRVLAADPKTHSELFRAADWMTSLGYSARNGFAVNFRELVEAELYEPTLSFYMALLYKNLVGERVLDVQLEASRAALFAHCTSLRRQPVPGALTLYGANLDDEPARFSVKLSRREEGGDVMQFILSHDLSGNIVVNGRPMYYEGDMRPVVKRLRPYKTLLINLPPKSFGFWVLANTNIEACYDLGNNKTEKEFVEALTVTKTIDIPGESKNIKTKRSMDLKGLDVSELEKLSDEIFDTNLISDTTKAENEGLVKRIVNLNNDLKNVHTLFETKSRKNKDNILNRVKRQINNQESDNARKKFRRQGLKSRNDVNTVSNVAKSKIEAIRKILAHLSNSKQRNVKERKSSKISNNKVNKRNSKQPLVKNMEETEETIHNVEEKLTRKRRNVSNEKPNLSRKVTESISSLENEIDIDSDSQKKLWKILHKIHEELKDLPAEDENIEYSDYGNESKDEDQIVVKTKLTDGAATINYKEKSKHGLLKSTVSNVMSVLSDLNNNLNRFWNSVHILEV